MNKTRQVILFLLFLCMISIMGMSQSTGIIGDSTINRCETKSYTVSMQNDSGNDLTNIVVVVRLENLVGFSYVPGSARLDINGGGAFCSNDPIINGGYSGLCAPSPGTDFLTWDIDVSCGVLTLNNGDELNITFDLETGCTAVSGSLNTYIDYTLPGPTAMCDDTGVLNIQVNPGAVTIKKTPNVIPQVLGQDVTWTLTVENTGFGVIENVEVTDVLGTGLAYVSSTQGGNNSGQTTIWTSNEYGALASMDPGDILTMDITATVIACDNLDNTADVRIGCNPSPLNTCFDTSVDGGTARASVQRIVRTPNLEFSPPDISFTHCSDTENVSFTITNVGDGIAYDVYTIVDFTGFIVSNVSSGAIYNDVDHRFELAAPLSASGDLGDSYNLSFDLTYNTWCGSFPEGDLLWQKLYKDECDQEFYPPVELSIINIPASSSGLSVSKSGAGEVIQIGDPVTYTVTSSYTGLINCGSGNTTDITVVDTVPNGFTVTDAGGGVWVPGAGGTGGTITWTYTPPSSLNTTVTFQSPPVSLCETYCNTTFTNSIVAAGTDCCGCALSETDEETTAIECAEGVTSDKTSTSPTERCDDTTYTNTYSFLGGSGVVLSDLQFEEHAELQQVYNGNLTIMLGAANVTGCVAVTDNTPGGSLLLDFSGCAATSLAGQTLTITYDLTATTNTQAACASGSFYSWSSLDMGPSGSNCLGDGIIHETTVVEVVSPSMELSISGLGQIFHTCETKTITMTLTQASANTDPKDVKLVLSGLNYYVVNPAATICGGIAPVSCTPTIDGGGDYIWEFGDAFTGPGQSATIQLEVQKRCGGTGDLVATAYFDDGCTDDATADELCSVVAAETPALLLSGDLLIEKTPETYYAVTNQVQWEIYLTNRGTGTAYNVWVDDILGSGLLYEHGVNPLVVDNMTGVTINDSLDHNGGAINGASIEITSMAAGERRQITFIARQVDCNNLTNDVTASWGCIGGDCQVAVTDNSIVNIPAPNLINTNTITPAGGVDACSSPDGFITLRNAGQITCYNLQVTETLPPNLLYVSGSTRWRLNGGPWNGPDVAYDPNPTVSPLVWSSTEIPGLSTSIPGDTIEIEFDMISDCPFTGGNITCVTQYENPCADVFNTEVSTFTAAFNAPDITINKTRGDDPIDCNDAIQWTITVTNDSGYTLPIIWIEDTMDATFTYASSVGDPPYTSDNGTNVGQVVTWELRNVNSGDTVTLTLNATTDSAPCSPDLDNTVIAYWGCGLADGSSATKPGVDAPDDTLCLTSTGVTDVRTETRRPDLGYLSIAMTPVTIDSCNDSTQLTIVIENTGDVDAYTIDLGITLPPGITYNAGTAEAGLGSDVLSATAAIGAIANPDVSGNVITFFDFNDKGNNLEPVIQAAGGSNNDTLVLRFTVQSACYETADVDFDLRFYDCCDDNQYDETTSQQLAAVDPVIDVYKSANLTQVDCGDTVEFTIQVVNSGVGNAEVVRVVDYLENWLDYVPGSFTHDQPGTITFAEIGGNPQQVGWEFNDLGPGATANFTFEATLNPDGFPNQNNCALVLRQNNVMAQWACGTTGDAVDDNPNTTGYDCTQNGMATDGPITLEMPNLVVTSITPDMSCTSDGNFTGSISVRVTNNGDGDTSGTFTVEVTDGKGWTGTGTYGVAIAAGDSADVTIDTTTWNPDCQPCAAPYSFNATVDLNNDICECNETDNTTSSATVYTAPIPDLEVDSDTLAVVCTNDGQTMVSGTVTLINNGCNTGITSNIPMRFTLYDNTGCGGNIIEQWTEIFSSVNMLAGGGTQAFTISNHTLTSNMCNNSTGCQVSIFVEADYNDSVCECDGTNNTYCADNKNIDIPDVEVSNDTLTVTCLDDGQVSVSGAVTLINNGCGSNLNSNIPMRFTLYDNTGCAGNQIDQWTQTFGGVNIASGGGAQVFAITPQTLTSDMIANSSGCQISIRIEADYNNSVCECDGSNNTYCADNKNIDIPDLRVSGDSLVITCLDDDQFRVSGSITLVNDGCGSSLNSNIPVRFILYDEAYCRGSQVAQWTETLVGGNIASGGGSQVFAITNRDITADLVANSTDCRVSIRIEADYNDIICESDGTDNAICSNFTVRIPDLRVNSVTPLVTCSSDGDLNGTVTVNVSNIGCGNTVNTVVRVASDPGCGIAFTDRWILIDPGESRNVTFYFTPDCADCSCTFTATIDPDNDICESNGANNSQASAYTMMIPDIEIQSDTLAISCSDDNQVTVSGSITLVNNGCGSNLTANVPMRFTLYDNTGCGGGVVEQWTETFSSVSMAPGGGTQVFPIANHTFASNLCLDSTGCQVSIFVEADYNSSICECDGTDNTHCADNINVDIPDIGVDSDTLTVTCLDDGQVTVSGNITLANNGCGNNLNSDVPMRFTLFDNTGCAGNQLDQWTQTFSGVNIASGGGNQVFAITPQTITSDMVTNSTGCQVSIRVEADYSNTICECNGLDNTYCADNINVDIPDIEVNADTLSITCTDDGQYSVTGTVTLLNNGCGINLNSNIPVRFTMFDNTGCAGNQVTQWTETFTSVNIPSGGGTQTFTITEFNDSGDLVTNSTGCQVSILVEADYNNTICESNGTDNTSCSNINISIPNLVVNSVGTSVNCISDGNLTGTTVNVSNTGCGDANNVVLRLTSDCGLTFSDQTISLTAGQTRDVIFTFTVGLTNCNCNFTATIDPENAICESDGTDNTQSSVTTMSVPDIEVDSSSLVVSCADDGEVTVSGTVTLLNNGCGTALTENVPMRFTLNDSTGCSGNAIGQWTEIFSSVNIPSGGGTQTFTVSPQNFITNMVTNSNNCQVSIFIEADYNLSVCEWDGTNNTHCADNINVDIPDMVIAADTLGVTCFDDGQVTVSGTVTVNNSGCGSNMTDNIPVRFTLYDNTGCAGNMVAQWTDTLSSVNIPSGGGNQTFTINPYNIVSNLVDNSTGCQVSIRMEADYNNAICESDGANNTYCADYIDVEIPDLEVQTESLIYTLTDDGEVQVTGTITIMNNGCGPNLTDSITVRFTHFDNISCTGNMVFQWTETFSSVNIPSGGGTQTFTITPYDVTANLCANSANCRGSLLTEVDYSNSICESDGTDNSLCNDKTIDVPDLTINSVASTVVCNSDGSLDGTTVNVGNSGCGDAVDVVVRLVSDCGLTFADQTVNLAAGETREVFFPFVAGIANCTCNFTATIDPDNTIFECDGMNNTQSAAQSMMIPDLEVESEALLVNCSVDGVIQVSGRVTLINNGCGPNFTGSIPMRFNLFSNTNGGGSRISQWTQNFSAVNIPSAGGTQTFTIRSHEITANFCTISTNCQVSLLIETDYNNTICEWDGTDNNFTTNKTSDCLDLEIVSITPSTDCTEDSALNGTIAVTLRNSGGNPITQDFYIRVEDGEGWTSEQRFNGDLGGSLPLAAGASAAVTFEWNRTFDPNTCHYANISAQVDSRDEICQCTAENDNISTSYQVQLPNLKPTAVIANCSADGFYQVQVTIENDGCSDAGSFVVHLEDDHDNNMDLMVDSLGQGASTTIIFNDWPSTCDPETVNFSVTVDANQEICEITGNDNLMQQTYTNISPDLIITEVVPSTSCGSSGKIDGNIEITIQNNGNGPVADDFKVIVDDGEGWTTEMFYRSDLNGTLPINAGETVTVGVNWNREFSKEPFTCNFNSIKIGLDNQTSVCECATANNDTITSYKLPYTDLSIESLLPICHEDGQLNLQVVVGKNGCDDQKDNFDITFSDSFGNTRTLPFTTLGGTLPLRSGTSQTVNLPSWEFNCSQATTDFTVSISRNDGSCDLIESNNMLTVTHQFDQPDLLLGDITWTCNTDGSISFTVTVMNKGYEDANNVPIRIYDENGQLLHTRTMNLPDGVEAQFTFTTGAVPKGQNLSFRFVIDEDKQFCECDGTNNEKTTTVTCDGGGEPQLKLGKFCPPGQGPGGLFKFELQIQNTGNTDLNNVKITDFLMEGFQYVRGTSVLNGKSISDPQISEHLIWNIGALPANEMRTLIFTAVADADIDPGRYCNEAIAEAVLFNGAVTVTSEQVQCCTVVTGEKRAGCCLRVEEWGLSPRIIPEGPISFVEPYFNTEAAMFNVYAICKLWKDFELEKASMSLFMKERMHHYARSTIDEFYLNSKLGLTLPDGTLWLSHAGGYPEIGNSWVRKQVNETMTASQIGFELLALNETIQIEKRQEIKDKLHRIVHNKLTFLNHYIDALPHAWEIKVKQKSDKEIDVTDKEEIEKVVSPQNEDATLYDKSSLYLAMTELKKSGYVHEDLSQLEAKIREMLGPIDQSSIDGNNLREEFIFILALLEADQKQLAKSKIDDFESTFKQSAKKSGENENNESNKQHNHNGLENLYDYALAAAVDYKAGGSVYKEIEQQMKQKFYLKDLGIFAEKQPDFTFKIGLQSLAPLILSFNEGGKETVETHALVLYRTFDEVGLFLKKRNLSVGKPLYSVIKNYPYSEPLLPVLNFTKSNKDIAPVFSQDAVIHSTQLKPMGEVFIPGSFSKIISPSFENNPSTIAKTSFELQYFGRLLKEDKKWVIQEEGRSFDEIGKRYVDSLLKSGAGLQYNNSTLIPFNRLAVKGPNKTDFNLEPHNVGSGTSFSTETLANYLLAEKLYIEGKGKYADHIQGMVQFQYRVLEEMTKAGYIPQKFKIFIEEGTNRINISPSVERASKITMAKLFYLLPKEQKYRFLSTALEKNKGKLKPTDLIFLSAVPECVPYFVEEIKELVDLKDTQVSVNAADVMGRQLIGDDQDKIQESLENLKKHWDKEAVLPKSDKINHIERGLIYHHQPQEFILSLMARYSVQGASESLPTMDFQFERILNCFTHLLENEWGVEWNSFLSLPSSEYQIFREEPKENAEPGDLLTFRVRVDNTCPEGYGSARDLPSLYLKAAFTPSLFYAGTQRKDELDVLGDFKWNYHGLTEGSYLEYFYQALIPDELNFNFIDGWIYAGGRQGFEAFGPESASGDQCEDIYHLNRLRLIPFAEIQGLVFADKNLNGIKDVGESGIANILVKDTRGRIFRSNAEGRFTVLAGDDHEGLQVELKSIPANYLMIDHPTRLVNRHYTGEIYFGLVPCKTVSGFIFLDENQNDAYDEGELRPEGVVLKAKDKEVITGKDGQFIFRNLPVLWQQWIEINDKQPFYNNSLDRIKIQYKEDFN